MPHCPSILKASILDLFAIQLVFPLLLLLPWCHQNRPAQDSKYNLFILALVSLQIDSHFVASCFFI